MKILVYPHDLNMGGSQLNAIELAAALRPFGVDCTVFGRPGVLNARIAELGLQFVEAVEPVRRPSPAVVRQLRTLISKQGFDIIHAYEWPPTLEARLAVRGSAATIVSTVMSMAVAPFIPKWIPLIVGTQQIAAAERVAGRPRVEVLEPPVDLRHDIAPPKDVLDAFRQEWGLDGRPLVVSVSRLATQLKLEGLLTAINVAGRQTEFQLLVVGNGPARAVVERAARRANESANRRAVILSGELVDPRPAYAAADIVIGMGGSALRALAFAKPLLVQGERGFFEPLTSETLPLFRWQGWYGVGESPDDGPTRLRAALGPLLKDVNLRALRGTFGRQVVEEDFSLVRAAQRQLEIYRDALMTRYSPGEQQYRDARSAAGFVGYHAGRRWSKWRGGRDVEDFNAKPVAGATVRPPASSRRTGTQASGTVIYFAGVPWQSVPGTDHELAKALARHRPVLWVDPPQSVWRNARLGLRIATEGDTGITRLSMTVPPGVTRPGVRQLSLALVAGSLAQWLRRNNVTPLAWVCSGTEPFLATVPPREAPRIYFATDDFVAAAALWKMRATHLHSAREKNLAHSDLVLAVTGDLADILRRGELQPVVFPNGCDLERDEGNINTPSTIDVEVTRPIAGVVGQFNERLEIELLEMVQQRGLSLLLVGPRSFTSPAIAARFESLINRPNVQWIDRVPKDAITAYLRCLDVGLTPYRNTAFNRRSFPLKTLEYLAAGLPVVSTDVPPLTDFDPRFVQAAASPTQFTDLAVAMASQSFDPEEIRSSVSGFDWRVRAEQLLTLVAQWQR